MSLWDEKFATGNETVDNDHKEIFSLVEEVLRSSAIDNKEKNETAINFLATYAVGHFEREENLMAESDYPNTAAHTKEHRDFMAVAMKLKADFDNGGYALGELDLHPETLHLSKVIYGTVINWLTEHVMGSDRNLAEHYKKWKDGE
ncbi:MAG: hemerythrin family protein [Defluviitaleaceae bacterium]|nr:hemerythrin family protein [Defluviitaleaceae bacterium]MCL2263373.1 hemerythrin family protein [Defluviitaleaceae bacterium]